MSPCFYRISFPVRTTLPSTSGIIFVFTIQHSHSLLLVSGLIMNLLMQILVFTLFVFKVHSITELDNYYQNLDLNLTICRCMFGILNMNCTIEQMLFLIL